MSHRVAALAIPELYRNANMHCDHHRHELLQTKTAGCLYCITLFPADEIVEWVYNGQTALCRRCEIDSILPVVDGSPDAPSWRPCTNTGFGFKAPGEEKASLF